MAQYAIAFDMDTVAMTRAGLTRADKTRIYQAEIPDALARCGFVVHAQGSLYHTRAEHDPITALMRLQETLRERAPNFGRFVGRVHVFRMEEWSDVTELLTHHVAGPVPPAEAVLETQEDIAAAAAQ